MTEARHIVIAIPVYNDWISLVILLREIDRTMEGQGLRCSILAIDDGSLQSCSALKDQFRDFRNIQQVESLHLASNLGHQKAIALGLAYINEHLVCDHVIVMDADGEDQPNVIPRLIEMTKDSPDSIIFAKRSRRSEGWVFRFFYALFKIAFRLLTGDVISFGNFCLIPFARLRNVVYLPEIWNHFAAGIMHAHLSFKTIPTTRGKRYIGKSSMNMVSLIIHGLSAISVYIEVLAVRLIFVSLSIISMDMIGFLVLLYIKYGTHLAIPGWATSVTMGLLIITFQAILFLMLLLFVILNYRSIKLFIPAKDYKDYIMNIENLYSTHA